MLGCWPDCAAGSFELFRCRKVLVAKRPAGKGGALTLFLWDFDWREVTLITPHDGSREDCLLSTAGCKPSRSKLPRGYQIPGRKKQMRRRKGCLLTGMCYKYGQRSQRTHHVKDKQYHAFTIGINPEMVRDICGIASLLGVQPQAIVADALDDWMRSIAPVRLENALAVLDGNTATLRRRPAQPDRAGQEAMDRCRLPAYR